ncbi:hypothetical protein ASE26_16760 [Duganella sp. Root198D2]|nr:hypothetical protein ASD07_10920 [Duganella sp. Root336D2]KRC02859.1 hypothetical protein ASE26_16760 [Duganella sp. Root198D2]
MIIICSAGPAVLAEDVFYPGGKKQILSTAEKVQRSMGNAAFIAEGRFIAAQPGHKMEVLDNARGMQELEFQISQRFDHGKAVAGKTIPLKLVTYRPAEGKAALSDSQALSLSRDVERKASGSLVVFDQYQNALANARAPLLKAPDYLKEFFVVPVAVGGLDNPYRLADVVVQLRKKYIIFVMREIDGSKPTTMFQNELDIYDADDAEVIAALGSTK